MKRTVSCLILLLISLFTYADNRFFCLKNNNSRIKITTEALEKLPESEIITSTNFIPTSKFSGSLFSDFKNKYNIQGKKIRVFSWDDYSYSINIDELIKYHAIIAYKKNKKYIDVAELGPFAIIYPKDSYAELNNMAIDAKTVWQIKEMEIIK
ncbi:oxidoreductase [Enterobacteriaceae bacterium LUAb1]